jgi:hypothetical protein
MHTGEFVTYYPSKGSGFGHALRRRRVKRAWEDVQRFYAACADVANPVRIELSAARPTQWDDDATMLPVLDRALQHFGPPHRTELSGGSMWPSGEPVKGGRCEWDRTLDQFDADVAYLIAGEPWPKSVIGPVTLRFNQSFQWKRELTQSAIGHPKGGNSGGEFTIWLQRNCFVQPSLSFPFVHDDPSFLDFLQVIRPHVPFRMHSNHFRRAVPAKEPGTFQTRKMPWPVVLT